MIYLEPGKGAGSLGARIRSQLKILGKRICEEYLKNEAMGWWESLFIRAVGVHSCLMVAQLGNLEDLGSVWKKKTTPSCIRKGWPLLKSMILGSRYCPPSTWEEVNCVCTLLIRQTVLCICPPLTCFCF